MDILNVIDIKKCIDCKGKIYKYKNVKRCKKCYIKWLKLNCKSFKRKSYKGKNNPNYRHGKKIKKYRNCIKCGKKLSKNPSTYCRSCWQIGRKMILVKHHINKNIYDNRKSNILFLSNSGHLKLHHKAYDYLIKIGKIKDYINWFKKNYVKE
jgi:hypothetical protein